MLDYQLFQLIISALTTGETVMGIAGTPIAQNFQPTQQGVNTAPTIFIHKISDRRYGFLQRTDVWDVDTAAFIHTESQQYESVFQISTLSTQNPATDTQYTASDMANFCAAIMQSSATIAYLQSNNVGIEKISDIRNPYFSDDRKRNEASPSFDFTLTHKQIIATSTPIIDATVINLYEV